MIIIMTNKETKTLKPCPFCGSKAELSDNKELTWCSSEDGCSLNADFFMPVDEWNTRSEV